MATIEDLKKIFALKSEEELVKIYKKESEGYSKEEIKLAAEELIQRGYFELGENRNAGQRNTSEEREPTERKDESEESSTSSPREINNEDVRIFLGKNADYFLPKWKVYLQTGDMVSFNVWAMLFGPTWMAFLKMHVYAYSFLAIYIAVTLVEIALGVTKEFNWPTTIIMCVVTGLCGNYWYFNHVEKKIAEVKVQNLDAESEKEMLTRIGGSSMGNAILFIVVSVLAFTLAFSVYNSGGQQSFQPRTENQQRSSEPETPSQSVHEFNVSDKSIVTNGNLAVAGYKVTQLIPRQIWQNAVEASPAKITKSPYSSIGKLIKFTGSVYKVEELPPTPDLTGQWVEVLIQAVNQNAPLGVTTVDFIYNGDVNKIDPNTYITCAGYFIGTYEGHNAMGGTVEGMVVVGNAFKSKY